MDLTTDFKAFQDLVQASLVNVTRSATQVSNQDLSFHRSSSEKLSRSLDNQNAYLLRLTNKLLKAATQDTQLKPPSLRNQDSIEDNWRGLVDVVDGLLEKADSSLDEFSGATRPQSPARNDTEPPRPSRTGFGVQRWAKDSIQKPQTTFEKPVNNHDDTPWRPLLQTKPHASVSSEKSIGSAETGYKHPYAQEIEDYKYPHSAYQYSEPLPFTPIDESKAIYVDTEEGVREMLQDLREAKEIAIDLEHNDLRSYVGLVSLMQISTRDKDWIIDTLKPWREKLQMLNEVFADPNILKVLHGSNMDIIWLQRDLGLYIVGLFDTFHAASALQFPGKGLKHLLLQFANVHAQKQFQLADWRIRPLPQELLDYARSDTHYLLMIYDQLRNMLIQGSSANVKLTDYVLTQSKKEALQVYHRQSYDLETGGGHAGWFNLLTMRSTNTLSKEQLGVFRALHAWRDRKAREQDDGVQFILPNRTLWLVAEHMPEKPVNFHQMCRGEAKFVQERIPEICEVVKQGKLEGKEGKSHVELLEHSEKVLGVTARRPHKERKPPPQTTYGGMADTLRQLAASRPPDTLNYDGAVDIENPIALRSSSSAFWGNVQPQNQRLPADIVAATEALASILPLRDFIAATEVADTEKVEENTQTVLTGQSFYAEQIATMKPATAKAQLRNKAQEILILRTPSATNGQKRKADEVEEHEGDEISFTPVTKAEFNVVLDAKEAGKAEKRARKAANRAAKKAEAAAAAQNTTPFDYANAPSLLTAPQEDAQGQKDAKSRGGASKLNHIAAKALDTTTGARRNKMGKELAGRSKTFKS